MGVRVHAAIVDYGLGNLFSVGRACEHVGMRPVVTDERTMLAAADVIILPGVGAFGDAMAALRRTGLDAALTELVAAGKPLVGVCLGLQLLMDESDEFGRHQGLGLIGGSVRRLPVTAVNGRTAKVPQVGWNAVRPPANRSWDGTPLAGQPIGAYFYFVHSFVACPTDPAVVLAEADYGGARFCAALGRGRVFGCQFHPERSASPGLAIYRKMATLITDGDWQ